MQPDKEQTTTTAEEKGAKFLQWIADNEKEMRHALKKNCTFDPEIFDDVFSEAIINVYNTIVKNNQEIANIKNYFFLACKWQYQMRQNQHRKHIESAVRDNWHKLTFIYTDIDEDAKERDIADALTKIKETLTDEFGEVNTEMFFYYWQGRVRNDMNYKMIAQKYNLTNNAVKRITNQMRDFVIEEMPYLREILQNDYADNQ